MKASFGYLFLACTLVAGVAHAETAAPAAEKKMPEAGMKEAPAAGTAMEMPKPAPEMEKLKMFMPDGEWKCEGNVQAPGSNMPHKVMAKVPMKSEMNGFWHMARYEESKTKDNPHPMANVTWYGYDMASKMFVRTSMNNMGGMEHLTSNGPEGDKMTFTGDMMMGEKKMPSRVTFEKKGSKEMMMTMEMDMGGNWMKAADMTCKK
jgi:hypothetical protein